MYKDQQPRDEAGRRCRLNILIMWEEVNIPWALNHRKSKYPDFNSIQISNCCWFKFSSICCIIPISGLSSGGTSLIIQTLVLQWRGCRSYSTRVAGCKQQKLTLAEPELWYIASDSSPHSPVSAKESQLVLTLLQVPSELKALHGSV